MWRWSQRISKNRINAGKDKIRPHEQQQLDDKSNKIQRLERKRRKVHEDLVAIIWAEKSNLSLERFAPNHPLQVFRFQACILLCSDLRFWSWVWASPRCLPCRKIHKNSHRWYWRGYWRGHPDSETITRLRWTTSRWPRTSSLKIMTRSWLCLPISSISRTKRHTMQGSLQVWTSSHLNPISSTTSGALQRRMLNPSRDRTSCEKSGSESEWKRPQVEQKVDVTVLTCCYHAHFLKSDGDRNTEVLTMQHIYNYGTNEKPIVTELTYINFSSARKVRVLGPWKDSSWCQKSKIQRMIHSFTGWGKKESTQVTWGSTLRTVDFSQIQEFKCTIFSRLCECLSTQRYWSHNLCVSRPASA